MSAFQEVFNNATSIGVGKRKRVAQTQSRSGVIKSTSLGGQLWQFEVQLPDGTPYDEYRQTIEKLEALDRVQTGKVKINTPGQEWINEYQGDLSSSDQTSISVTTNGTNTVTFSSVATLSGSQYIFRAGDYIQMGTTGAVYTVAEDVAGGSASFKVHRPVREADSTYTLVVGRDVEWTLICSDFPNWQLYGSRQVSWSGPFVFVEAV